MSRMVRAVAVTVLTTALVGGCSEATAPAVAESPPWFAFEVASTGAHAVAFTGQTQVITARNGHAEPVPATSDLVVQDYTVLTLTQPDLDFDEPNAYLSVGLVGPFDVGTFPVRSNSSAGGPHFSGTYSVRHSDGLWEHYEITGGSITLFRKGVRLSGTLDLQSTRVQRVNRGFSEAPATTSLTLTGRIAAQR
jgi:hypothetical protein